MGGTQPPDHQPRNHVNLITTEMLHNDLLLIGDAFNISSHKSVQIEMKMFYRDSSFVVLFSLREQPTKDRLWKISIGIS